MFYGKIYVYLLVDTFSDSTKMPGVTIRFIDSVPNVQETVESPGSVWITVEILSC